MSYKIFILNSCLKSRNCVQLCTLTSLINQPVRLFILIRKSPTTLLLGTPRLLIFRNCQLITLIMNIRVDMLMFVIASGFQIYTLKAVKFVKKIGQNYFPLRLRNEVFYFTLRKLGHAVYQSKMSKLSSAVLNTIVGS